MKKERRRSIRALVVFVVVFCLSAALAIWGVNYIHASVDAAQIALIEDTVHRSLMSCYALEGAYPSSLEYLKENYNLSYDESRYTVYYDAFASNIMPSVKVRLRGDVLK